MKTFNRNLLLRFLVISLVAVLTLGVASAIIIGKIAASGVLKDAMQYASDDVNARTLRQLSTESFAQPMRGERYETFYRFMMESIVSPRIARIKVWDRGGRVIFSTDASQVGQTVPIKPALAKALQGETAGEISVPRHLENAQEQLLGTLIEVYTPAVFPGSAEVVGAIEVYLQYARYAETIAAIQTGVYVATGAGAVLLLGVFVFIMDRGWKTIQIHQEEIHHRLNEAQQLNTLLKEEIEARNRIRQALTETQLRYETLVNSIDGIVYESDAHSFRPLFVSQQAERLLGYPAERLVNDPTFLADLIHPDDRDRVVAFRAGETAAQRNHQCEYRTVGADGRVVWLRDVVRVVVEHDQPVLLRGVMVDITEHKQMEEALRYQAFHDALTGLPNRALLNDRLQQAIVEARRENSSLGLLIMDLDNFKEVNDTFGHHWGDLLLQQVAHRLRKVLRESDTVARLGGDEFAILLRWPGTGDDAPLVAGKIVEALQSPFEIEGQTLVIGASIGIALYPDHGVDDKTLLRRADVAMYVSKRANGGYASYAANQDPSMARTSRDSPR